MRWFLMFDVWRWGYFVHFYVAGAQKWFFAAFSARIGCYRARSELTICISRYSWFFSLLCEAKEQLLSFINEVLLCASFLFLLSRFGHLSNFFYLYLRYVFMAIERSVSRVMSKLNTFLVCPTCSPVFFIISADRKTGFTILWFIFRHFQFSVLIFFVRIS